ncbi:MAG: prepilin-type N-terminal cleavage/methylation domain-containing protein [Phycisphaeraceae bacterium]|nr:prepilin-type N-terminal cleavage/methylation domain-containing protein [Phycisphaerales bacterium]MCB9842498.1 prepilin-type N-terminal cleavage/methylation domain-containing protein [Phycisphaeraceae bacterium]
MSSVRSHRGLTLVELLAAIVILSAMAAAAVSVQRDATSAARHAQHTNEALHVLDRWRSLPVSSNQQDKWSWTDEDGVTWSVRIGTAGQDNANVGKGNLELNTTPWEVIVVERFDAVTGLPAEALRVSRLSHEPVATIKPGGV